MRVRNKRVHEEREAIYGTRRRGSEVTTIMGKDDQKLDLCPFYTGRACCALRGVRFDSANQWLCHGQSQRVGAHACDKNFDLSSPIEVPGVCFILRLGARERACMRAVPRKTTCRWRRIPSYDSCLDD